MKKAIFVLSLLFIGGYSYAASLPMAPVQTPEQKPTPTTNPYIYPNNQFYPHPYIIYNNNCCTDGTVLSTKQLREMRKLKNLNKENQEDMEYCDCTCRCMWNGSGWLCKHKKKLQIIQKCENQEENE